MTGKHPLDLLNHISLYAKDFAKEHPLSIVHFLDSETDESFNESVAELYHRLADLRIGSSSQNPSLETLSKIFKNDNFDAPILFVCYNCCQSVLQNKDWHHFDWHLEKIYVVFLAPNEAKSDRFNRHRLLWPDDNHILEYLEVQECEKEDALQLIWRFDGSLVDLKILDTYRREQRLKFADINDAESLRSIKEQLAAFRQEWISQNFDFRCLRIIMGRL